MDSPQTEQWQIKNPSWSFIEFSAVQFWGSPYPWWPQVPVLDRQEWNLMCHLHPSPGFCVMCSEILFRSPWLYRTLMSYYRLPGGLNRFEMMCILWCFSTEARSFSHFVIIGDYWCKNWVGLNTFAPCDVDELIVSYVVFHRVHCRHTYGWGECKNLDPQGTGWKWKYICRTVHSCKGKSQICANQSVQNAAKLTSAGFLKNRKKGLEVFGSSEWNMSGRARCWGHSVAVRRILSSGYCLCRVSHVLPVLSRTQNPVVCAVTIIMSACPMQGVFPPSVPVIGSPTLTRKQHITNEDLKFLQIKCYKNRVSSSYKGYLF